ncbi:hypothetical protein QBC34DRAFT_388509 [Podospora aff. communis PSN243]|uniref:Uncharacterized protein n=1 Tax=Podospora aff. communis PSN243 TaxID=3040156 RepID=A0AAV9H869_9PEZI|nr:hypothetical protein QBC34DRAFT_388509 [Podospora aff. communis PSN243]
MSLWLNQGMKRGGKSKPRSWQTRSLDIWSSKLHPVAQDTEQPPSSAPMLGRGNWGPGTSREEDAKPAMNELQLAEESKDKIESVIDSFRGRSEDEGTLGFTLFMSRSPYSPLLLDRYLGWKPTPRDATDSRRRGPHDDQYWGGWTEAFYDLLRISSAAPMMDPLEIQAWDKMAKELFASTNGVLKDEITKHSAFWVLTMSRTRLDEVLFPFYKPKNPYRSPRTMTEWVDLRRTERRARQQVRGVAGALREALPNVVRIREVKVDETETEEDAYRAVDRQTDAPKKWDDLVGVLKRIGEDEDKTQETRVISSSENTKPTWSGGTKTVTKKEWVDEAGAVHTETVVSIKNTDGEETSRRVNHSVRSDENAQEGRLKPDVRIPNDGDMGPAKDDKKPAGWFWSRK